LTEHGNVKVEDGAQEAQTENIYIYIYIYIY